MSICLVENAKNIIEVDGDTAIFKITHKGQEMEVIVDATDLPLLEPETYRWFVGQFGKSGGLYYAASPLWTGHKSTTRLRFMHRVILGLTERKLQVAHGQGGTLDNRRVNIRVATHAENRCDVGPPRNNTTGYKGVSPSPYGFRA